MGIKVEYNPDLALRNIREFEKGNRLEDECIPNLLVPEKTYAFLKRGQRNYWLEGEIPLLETDGNGKLSRPLASIRILITNHFIREGEVWTTGEYSVREVYGNDDKIHFEGFTKLESS
jgi:hypothetical protein